MLNQVIVVGRLVADPEVKKLESGKEVTNITLAVNRSYKNAEGVYETDFIDMDINEYEEIIGDIYFNVEGMDNQNQLHLRLNGEAIDEVLINLQIELENDLQEAKHNFFGFLLFKNNNHIVLNKLRIKIFYLW